ncbi:unnamed protein product [Linum trigynum]|uniref:Uncharacterized protein n=1 Tax=Linum trigynum TaxID=586398 RepID=A0AAV2D902_9ROSI
MADDEVALNESRPRDDTIISIFQFSSRDCRLTSVDLRSSSRSVDLHVDLPSSRSTKGKLRPFSFSRRASGRVYPDSDDELSLTIPVSGQDGFLVKIGPNRISSNPVSIHEYAQSGCKKPGQSGHV